MASIKLKKAQAEVQEVVQGKAVETEQTIISTQVGLTKKQKRWEDPSILREDENKADEYSRHYILNNGATKSVFSATPVNYFDEREHKWKGIDNLLEESEDGFESKKGKDTLNRYGYHIKEDASDIAEEPV